MPSPAASTGNRKHETRNPGRRTGRLIVFDGIDGAGKTTQLRRLARRLRRAGVPVVAVRDPGATRIGNRIRRLLLDRRSAGMDVRCEVLLLLAARAQAAAEIIRPALAAGRVVLGDRFVSATVAYQGYGSGFPVDGIRTLAEIALDGLEPDLTLIFDIAPALARARLKRRPDRIEARDGGFHDKVSAGFRALVRSDPRRYHRIDASGTRDQVAAAVWKAVETLVGAAPARSSDL
jgi:dTMP kinase